MSFLFIMNRIIVTIHGKQYDLTTFAKGHPGGERLITDWAGKDGTEAFELVGHGSDPAVKEVLSHYEIKK